ncbi:LLM class flavin-dependent oxidoreductase [Alloacidobacterium dinghuense]|uniref:Luciferase-like monooxygenase n=1 Tax=Alloacidobacterium dinghuense TaxID=2763107 RepID=A0A7G8BM94_9BACT|nr:LLM class flavin-dependent oxidoreductase [Alloacidobacterium dinghuense]QNI33664.1 LLM class flavin-dependent oxidoreductase [Alloacidobacterium dinghuense]
MPQSSRLAFTPLSVLDLAPVKEGRSITLTFHETLDLAQHAEGWGYKRYWLAEHHNLASVACSATSVLIGYVAQGTSTIRVGSGGIMLPNHAPLVIAEQFGTLESIYPGRIDLGLGRAPGTDFPTMRALRRDLRNGDNFPELLGELRELFAEPKPNQAVRALPGAGLNIPIWLLGSSGFSAQLAGQLGLPFAFAGHFMPENTLAALDIYRSSFEPSDVLDKPYTMVGLPVLAADTDQEAQHLSTTEYLNVLRLIRNKLAPLAPPMDTVEGLANEFEQAAIASKRALAVVGSRETVRRKLEVFLDETQADELIITCNPYEHAARLRSYEIVGEIAKQAAAEIEQNRLTSVK